MPHQPKASASSAGDGVAAIIATLCSAVVRPRTSVASRSACAGPARSSGYRWFTDPASRELYDPRDHDFLSRLWASGLREVVGRRGPGSRAAGLVDLLLAASAEFRERWDAHEVGLRPAEAKRFVHPEVGPLELTCQTLVDPGSSQALLIYTAVPGSESAERLELLAVIGAQRL